MLRIAGCFNIVISIAHIIGLFFADWMFKVTGITEIMSNYAQIHWSIPYLLTIIVAIAFFLFGLYAFSLDGTFRPLPYKKQVVMVISIIYLLRGFGQIISDAVMNKTNTIDSVYSITAVIIGIIFLIGWLNSQKKHQ